MPTFTGTKAEVVVVDEWSDALANAMTELKWNAGLAVPQFQHRYYTSDSSISTLDQKVMSDETFDKINEEMLREAVEWAKEQARQKAKEEARKAAQLEKARLAAIENDRLKAEAEEKERVEMEALKSLPGYGMF